MKKIFVLLTMCLFAGCSSDSDDEIIDLAKYPLYSTKWICYDPITEPYNDYFIFEKEDGLIGLYMYYDLDKPPRLYELKLTYQYNYPNIIITYEGAENIIVEKGEVINNNLYIKSKSNEGENILYYKDETY